MCACVRAGMRACMYMHACVRVRMMCGVRARVCVCAGVRAGVRACGCVCLRFCSLADTLYSLALVMVCCSPVSSMLLIQISC